MYLAIYSTMVIGDLTIAGAPVTPFDVPLLWPSVSGLKEYLWDVSDI